MLRSRAGAAVLGAALVAGCTGVESDPAAEPPASSSTPTPTLPPTTSPTPEQPTATGTPSQPAGPVRFSATDAMRTVRHLARDIGPRQATSPAYAEAADWVHDRFDRLGYDVRRQGFRAPAGNSWGIDVPGGRTTNVIATPVGFDQSEPYLIVGAHLDTVPQAPGAEDNASGISVVLELARMAAEAPPEVPTMFVAFGAEEPRGDGDAWHHFGSRTMVDRLEPDQRRALVAMVSLDRVGVGAGRIVPLATGGQEPPVVRTQLERVADQLGIRTSSDLNQSSDHWSFDKAGLPAARVGSTPYAGYHSAGDVPGVVDPEQLHRVGRLMWAWINR